jgi:hypothetical protein
MQYLNIEYWNKCRECVFGPSHSKKACVLYNQYNCNRSFNWFKAAYRTHVGVRMYIVQDTQAGLEGAEGDYTKKNAVICCCLYIKLFIWKRFEECVREETAHLATLKIYKYTSWYPSQRDCKDWIRVRSHAPSIQSHRGTKVVWPDFQPMRVPEEPVCVYLFRQKPVFTSLHLKSPVHVHRLRQTDGKN